MPRKFDAEEYFSGSYGTYTAGDPETVEIKVESYQAKYLRSLPLHSSQEEIETTPEYSVLGSGSGRHMTLRGLCCLTELRWKC
jgi:hypothetical protein